MKFLLRDGAEGYKEVEGEPFSKNDPNKQYRPWAVTLEGRVVYSEWKSQPVGLAGVVDLVFSRKLGQAPLKSYDKAASQMRRREFETAMSLDAAAHPECCRTAVNRVSDGLRAYLTERTETLRSLPEENDRKNALVHADEVVRSRCFSDTGSGMLGSSQAGKDLPKGGALYMALQTLNGNDIAKILGIQVTFANKLAEELGYP